MASERCNYCSAEFESEQNVFPDTCPSCGRQIPVEAEILFIDDEPLDGPIEIEIVTDVERTPTLSLAGAIGWCLLLLLAQLAIGLMLAFVLAMFTSDVLGEGQGLLIAGALIASGLAMLIIACAQLRPDLGRKLALRPVRLLHVAIVALLVLPMVVVCEEISNRVGEAYDAAFSQHAHSQDPLQNSHVVGYTGLSESAYEALAGQPWLIVILIGCLLPGVCEELFFRGFLGRGLIARYGVLFGVAFTSLFFGLIHVDPVQACYAFVFGVVLHIVYLCTRSFLAPMALHATFNTVGFGIGKLQLDGTLIVGGPTENLWIPVPLLVSTVVVILILLAVLYSTRVRFVSDGDEEEVWSPGYVTASLPPVSFVGTTEHRGPKMLHLITIVAAYVAFGVTFNHAASAWLDSNSVWAQIQRADKLTEQDDYYEAVDAYSKAIAGDSDTAEAYVGRSQAYRMLGKLDEASQFRPQLEHYQQAADDR